MSDEDTFKVNIDWNSGTTSKLAVGVTFCLFSNQGLPPYVFGFGLGEAIPN